MPPNPPSKAHGFAMLWMPFGDMQISKSQKNIGPPSPIPGHAPDSRCNNVDLYVIVGFL